MGRRRRRNQEAAEQGDEGRSNEHLGRDPDCEGRYCDCLVDLKVSGTGRQVMCGDGRSRVVAYGDVGTTDISYRLRIPVGEIV
jgi:hypothetical protein